MTENNRITPELIELKNKQRAALRHEYWKQITDPHSTSPHIFDPAMQRFFSMKSTRIDFFRETPTTILKGLFVLVIPLSATIWWLKQEKDKKEAAFRAGKVAYKDRMFKFI